MVLGWLVMCARSFFIALLVTFFVTNFSFGACTSGDYQVTLYGQWCYGPSDPKVGGCESSLRPCTESCAGEYCVNSISRNNYYYYGRVHDEYYNDYCVGSGHFVGNSIRGYFRYRCSSKTEVDSLACEQEGGIWNGTSCVQSDTISCVVMEFYGNLVKTLPLK